MFWGNKYLTHLGQLQRFQFKQSGCPAAQKLLTCSSICPLPWHQKWKFFATAPCMFTRSAQQQSVSDAFSDMWIKAGGHCGQQAALVTTTPRQSILPSPLLTVKADSLHVTPPPSPSPPQVSSLAQLRLHIAWANLSHCRPRVPVNISAFPHPLTSSPPSTQGHPPTASSALVLEAWSVPSRATQQTC